MPSVTRRALLHASGLSLVTALTGCQTLTPTQSRERHAIDIGNYSTESVSFAVQVVDETGTGLFEQYGSVAEGKQASYVFTGTPTTIQFRLSDRPEQKFEWPTPSCANGGPAPKVDITYGMATSMEDTRVFGRCEAILTD